MCMCDSTSDKLSDDTVVDRLTCILWMMTVCVVRYSTE